MISTSANDTITYIITPFVGVVLVYVPGHDRAMTPTEFEQWAWSQALKNAAGRASAHP